MQTRTGLSTSLATLALLAAAPIGCADDSTGNDEIGATESTTVDTVDTVDTTVDTETGSSDTTTTDTTTTDTTDTTTDTTTTDTTTTDTDTTDTTTDTTETGDPCGPECCPGEFKCEGDISLICNGDGTDWEESEVCDPIQGVNCNPNFGICEGACSQANIGLSYIGCDYYPTVTLQYDLYNTAPKDVFAVAVANTGAEDAMIMVTQGANMIYDTVVPANSVEVITLPWVNALTKNNGPSALVVDGAYRLRSDRPIVVYQYNPLQSTTTNDASLLLPTNAWGNDTVVASWPQWNSIPAFYSVVASEDNTTVNVNPPPGGVSIAAGGGVAANGSGQVVLNESDVLQVITSANNSDVTGSLVSADKPVLVFGGHKCTNIPANITACDHLEEALFPTQTLADEYIVVPPAQVPNNNLAKAQMVRIVATEDNTSVTMTPDQGANQVLATAGQFIQLTTTQAAFMVEADKPVMVLQYMVGQSAGYGTSDPAMVQAVTPKQFRNDYLFFAAPTWTANFVDIIAPNNATVSVDGANVGGWIMVGNSGYSYTHVQLSNAGNGSHTVSSNQKVGISVYGVQSAGSYWYPGGLDLEINPQ